MGCVTHEKVLGLLTRHKQTLLHKIHVSPNSRKTADSCGKTQGHGLLGPRQKSSFIKYVSKS